VNCDSEESLFDTTNLEQWANRTIPPVRKARMFQSFDASITALKRTTPDLSKMVQKQNFRNNKTYLQTDVPRPSRHKAIATANNFPPLGSRFDMKQYLEE
jgi:hypothetical protein